MGFRLLLIAAMFSVMVNIAYAGDETQDDPAVQKVDQPVFMQADKDTQLIFDGLQFAAGSAANKIKLLINTNTVLNAYMDGYARLVIYTGTLNFTIRDRNDRDMLAGIIGHEIGHWVLGHLDWHSKCQIGTNMDNRNCEREADFYGLKLMTDAGYDCHHMSKFFKDIISTWGNAQIEDSSHPSDLERSIYIEKNCKLYQQTGQVGPIPYEVKVPEKLPEHVGGLDE